MVKLLKSSLSVFDVDVAYAYADAFYEVDGLYIDSVIRGIMVFEELSSASEECCKNVRRRILSPSHPPILWYGKKSEELRKLSKTVRLLELAGEGKDVGGREQIWRRIIELVYTYSSEVANALLYAGLMLSPWTEEVLARDILSDKGDLSSPAYTLLRLFTHMLASKEDIAINVDKLSRILRDEVECRKKTLRELLGKARIILVYPQLGTRRFSARGLARLVKSLHDHGIIKPKRITIVCNERIRRDAELVVEELRNILDHVPVEVKDEGEEVCEENCIALVMQDYRKEYLEKIVSPGRVDAVVVIPESYYIVAASQSRLVRTAGGFGGRELESMSVDDLLRVLALKSMIIALRG